MSGFFIDTTQRKNDFVSKSANAPLKHHRDDKSQNGSSQDFNAKGDGSFISQSDATENGINHRQTTDIPDELDGTFDGSPPSDKDDSDF